MRGIDVWVDSYLKSCMFIGAKYSLSVCIFFSEFSSVYCVFPVIIAKIMTRVKKTNIDIHLDISGFFP